MNNELLIILMLLGIPSVYLAVVYLTRGLHLLQFNVAFLTLAAAHGISPILVALGDGTGLETDDYVRFGIYAMAIVLFICCYEATRPARSRPRGAPGASPYDGLMGVVGWFLVAIGIGLLYVLIQKAERNLLYIPKYDLHLLYASVGPEKLAKDLVTMGVLALSYHYCRRRRFPVSFLLVLAAAVVLTAILSTRASLVVIILGFLLYYHFLVRPVSNRIIALSALSMIFVLGAWFEVLAFVLPEETYLGGAYSFDIGSAEWWKQYSVIFHMQSWYQIWQDVWRLEQQWGLTLLRSFGAALWPRFLGGPETGLSQWYVRAIGPAVTEGGGFAFSLIVEAYLNFGWIGPLVLFGLLGVLLRKADTLGRERMLFVRGVGFGSLIYIFMGDLNTVLKGPLGLYTLVPCGVYWCLRWLRGVALGVCRLA